MKTIDEIVQTFINDLKRTKEYKEAWKSIPETKDIIFDFWNLTFYQYDEIWEPALHIGERPHTITMDEEFLLKK